MSSERLVVDPITRIEGHLRIEAETGADGSIAQAYSAGTMVRGIEKVLQGRDPRDAWAFAQRICGVCTLVHGIASVRSVEDALDYPIPPNAQLIRNLMIAAQFVHDHVMHFYHLHALDWVDVMSAVKADPKKTSELAQSLSSYAKSSPGYFKETQDKLKGLAESGQLGIFANGYWGHPAYRLPAEANLMAVAHYLEALSWQREVVKLHTIFGGKNPHPNLLVGGAPTALSPETGGTATDMTGLAQVKNVIDQMQHFVNEVYLPDTVAIAGYYKDWFKRGEGVGNFLCYGDFPDAGKGMDAVDDFMVPPGVILDRDLSKVHPVDLEEEKQVQEFVAHSWYDYSVGNDAGLHPYDGETDLDYSGRGGPEPPYDHLNVGDGYSWLKSPRWRGKPMETGPLARVLNLYAQGHEPTKELASKVLGQLDQPVEAMFSTMGRTAARTLEAKIFADAMSGWYDQLMTNIGNGDLTVFNDEKWDPSTWPAQTKGVGFTEAPRGALAHWARIEDGVLSNYQAVVPSTWNAGPRDADGQPGPYEAALQDNHQLHDPDQPVEILRTIHSFDPCIACAVHLLDEAGEERLQVKVR